jgi:hypothetical protein
MGGRAVKKSRKKKSGETLASVKRDLLKKMSKHDTDIKRILRRNGIK